MKKKIKNKKKKKEYLMKSERLKKLLKEIS